MTLLLTAVCIELAALITAAVFSLSRGHPRSGLETEWDDPVPEQYHQAWSARQWVGHGQAT
ncbi:hypothetical protein [Deinococcus koreensis]|uniref:Uncharacterized protein n=1 Tax=Deinococcus koreensis TaxID=2054903 RepID=A0A2K3USJ0_9DEIO|nr:hypothetical protein [Deinococcus koreensis]PNY79515.1 hypothetical protein CVO96_18975 [Deinococcus koreensis]